MKRYAFRICLLMNIEVFLQQRYFFLSKDEC
jgi:hypothetical protein